MLALSRRTGEEIVFPTLRIKVTILGTRGGSVRIGIEAPEDVKVLRQELCQVAVPARTGERPRPASD